MIRTIEAIIEEDGRVRLLESVKLDHAQRALVTILEEPPEAISNESALLSEDALGRDWNRAEEDEAWTHLQREL